MTTVFSVLFAIITTFTMHTLNVHADMWQWWVMLFLPSVFGIVVLYDSHVS